MTNLGFHIEQVVDLLGLERADKRAVKAHSFNVKCPECDNKGFHLNINNDKDNWRCAKCGIGGGMLEMYVRFGMGEKTYTKQLGGKAIRKIKNQLNLDFNRSETVYKNDNIIDDYEQTRPDKELHEVFSALLDIPVLRLSSTHKQKLIKRGFTESCIIRNEYRTFPDKIFLPKGKSITYEMFRGEKLDVICKDKPELKRFRRKHIISGLYIGAFLNRIKGLDLQGVPGFFTIDGRWCFNYTPGMLIPVRNAEGQIVNIQVRTDNGKMRYITNSSKGFENGTTGKTRVHYCYDNAEIDKNTKVFLTEGPLKADICLSIMRDIPKYKDCNIAFITIMGVNATKELGKTIKYLNSKGCNTVFNLLDMDKITNLYVANAAIKINHMFKENKIDFKACFWDKNTAEKVLQEQNELLKDYQITVKYPTEDVFYKILFNTLAFNEKNIKLPDEFHEWNSETKGFDDFLKSKFKRTA